MARGRVGGSRSKISGRVGSEVYKITYNSLGKLTQVVQAAESSRVNNNTEPQARARMAMGMVERAMAALQQVITWSFEGVDRGQASANEFSRLNLPRIKADMANNWSGPTTYNYYKKGEVVFPAGSYIVSRGSLRFFWHGQIKHNGPGIGSFDLYTWLGVPDSSFATWSRLNDIQAGDTITFVGVFVPFFHEGDRCVILNMTVPQWWRDTMIVDADSFRNLFKFSGNISPDFSWDNDGNRAHIHWQDENGKGYTVMSHLAIFKSRWVGNKMLMSSSALSFQPVQFIDSWNNYTPAKVWSSWFDNNFDSL